MLQVGEERTVLVYDISEDKVIFKCDSEFIEVPTDKLFGISALSDSSFVNICRVRPGAWIVGGV